MAVWTPPFKLSFEADIALLIFADFALPAGLGVHAFGASTDHAMPAAWVTRWTLPREFASIRLGFYVLGTNLS